MPTLRCSFLHLLLAAVLVPLLPAWGESTAAAYAISDNATGHLLDAANGQKKLQVGSLTKIATAMVVLDWAESKGRDLSQLVPVPNSAAALTTPGGVGLHPGDQCSLRDLLYAALLQSDNQAADAIAANVGRALGSDADPVAAFVAQMNALARHLGMAHTRFLNAHGLDSLERSLPYSTAEDLARLTGYAMERASFRFYVSQRERKITVLTAAGEPSSFLLKNTNELLGTDGIDGVKTGTTRKAGGCVIVSAARAPESRQEGEKVVITPRRLNVVVLGAADRFAVARQLLARGWQLQETWAAAGRPTGKK